MSHTLPRRAFITGAASLLACRAFATTEPATANFINLFDDSYSGESFKLVRHMFTQFSRILREEMAITLRDSGYSHVRFIAGRWACNVELITPTIVLDCHNCAADLEKLAGFFDQAAAGPERETENGSTDLDTALAFGLGCCQLPASANIVNVYTDTAGRNTQIADISGFRQKAARHNMKVNGMIFGPPDALGNYFPRYVQSGEGSFTRDVRNPKALHANVRHSLVDDLG